MCEQSIQKDSEIRIKIKFEKQKQKKKLTVCIHPYIVNQSGDRNIDTKGIKCIKRHEAHISINNIREIKTKKNNNNLLISFSKNGANINVYLQQSLCDVFVSNYGKTQGFLYLEA